MIYIAKHHERLRALYKSTSLQTHAGTWRHRLTYSCFIRCYSFGTFEINSSTMLSTYSFVNIWVRFKRRIVLGGPQF